MSITRREFLKEISTVVGAGMLSPILGKNLEAPLGPSNFLEAEKLCASLVKSSPNGRGLEQGFAFIDLNIPPLFKVEANIKTENTLPILTYVPQSSKIHYTHTHFPMVLDNKSGTVKFGLLPLAWEDLAVATYQNWRVVEAIGYNLETHKNTLSRMARPQEYKYWPFGIPIDFDKMFDAWDQKNLLQLKKEQPGQDLYTLDITARNMTLSQLAKSWGFDYTWREMTTLDFS